MVLIYAAKHIIYKNQGSLGLAAPVHLAAARTPAPAALSRPELPWPAATHIVQP